MVSKYEEKSKGGYYINLRVFRGCETWKETMCFGWGWCFFFWHSDSLVGECFIHLLGWTLIFRKYFSIIFDTCSKKGFLPLYSPQIQNLSTLKPLDRADQGDICPQEKGTGGPTWESELGQARGLLCRRVAGTQGRTRECSGQEQETVPRERCPRTMGKACTWGGGRGASLVHDELLSLVRRTLM